MRLSTACVVALTILTTVACGDDDTETDSGTDSGSSSGSVCLEGRWDCILSGSSSAEMTIDGTSIAGSFTESTITLTVESSFTLDGDSISVTDTGGTGACPSTQVGEYRFSCDGNRLTFTQLTDDCVGRSNYFGCSWTRR